MSRYLTRLALLSLLILPGALWAQETPSGRITALQGSAQAIKGGTAPRALQTESRVYEGETIKTGADSRMEITMPDGSLMRLGEDSEVALNEIRFAQNKPSRFSARLALGRVWNSVKSLFKGSKHEVSTRTAVAGIRGTRYRMRAGDDYSTVLRVYAGSVKVTPIYQTVEKAAPGERKQVAGPQEVKGPQEVSVEEWTRIVGAQMEIAVGPDGQLGSLARFEPKDDAADPWVAWNLERDKAAGFGE